MSLCAPGGEKDVQGRVETPAIGGLNSDDEEDETPLEPFFNYRLIDEKDVKNMLRDDRITSMAAHDKFLVIGTHQGYIYAMSHEGTMDHAHIPRLKPHRAPVSRLEVEEAGNYVISCGIDARVVISGLGTSEMNYVLSTQVMPKAVGISPNFSKSTSPPLFVIGERNLIFYEKKFFSYKDTVAFHGGEKDGFISRISWHNNYVAFTNDTGTRIYDKTISKMITLINPSHDVDRIRTSRFPPSHCWLSEESLAIGWADTVTVVVMVDMAKGVKVTKHSEIHYSFHLNGMFLSGISYVADSHGIWEKLILFGLKAAEGEDENDFCDTSSMVSMQSQFDKNGPIPLVQVSVISAVTEKEYKLHSEDRLGLEASSSSQPCHFSMVGLPTFDAYFLSGPKSLVSATPYGAINAVKWRIEKGLWEEAFDLAKHKAHELEETEYGPRTVGRSMIEHYMTIGKPRLATAKLKEVCHESRAEWEWAIGLFEQYHLSTLLADVLPTAQPQLEPECYESVLQAALWNDTNLFKKLVQSWSPDLYRAGSLAVATVERLQRAISNPKDAAVSLTEKGEENLYRALAHLYLYDRKFDSALKLYINVIRDAHIFAVIDKYQLFDQVKDQISELMTINTDLALRLLLDNEDSVQPSFVMSKLTQKPKLQMAYLTRLFSKGEGSEYVDIAIRLYAEYDRKKLQKFLRNTEKYNITMALDICKQKGYHEETILLLGKGGFHAEALTLMLTQYRQLDRAVEYCREQDDPDLWAQLIDLVIQTPEHVVRLLQLVGSSINPLSVIQKIPLGLEIQGLRDALAKVLRDCAARVELLKGCRSATYSDTTILLSDFLKVNRRAFPLGPRSACIVCRKRFITEDTKWTDTLVFGCGHFTHAHCCIESEKRLHLRSGTCPSCSEERDEILG